MPRDTTQKASAVARLRTAASSVVMTGRGIGFLVGAVVSFVAAPLLSLPALLYVTGLLLGLLIFSTGFVFLGHSRVVIERSFSPQVVAPGLSAKATLRVTNLSVLPCSGASWEDHLPQGISGDAAGLLPPLGGSHSSTSRSSFSYGLQGLRRGRHLVGPLRIDVLDPFGLASRRHAFGSAEPLTVLPKIVELPAIAPRGESDDGVTRPAPQHVGVGDDDIIARSYLPGDAMNRLHWKATAHRGELMVRQVEQQINPRAAVFLECHPDSQGTARDRKGQWEHSASLEWGIVAAASIMSHLVRAGYVVALQSNALSPDRHIADGHDTVEDAMVDLAVLEPDANDHDRIVAPERASFVVLGHLTADRARHWTSVVAASRAVLAFVAAGSRPEALEVLEAAQWRVVIYRPTDDVAELWSEFDGVRADVAS
ncbi:DUF58 domain-containing protein [Aeromicrobium sp.]|uniref:DUF58 domain-containing protein n=1 Tax=Aeromicrobium sp. TaxID=1871063 RepID=UPI0019B44DF1|nr:DUF58 domain-containing protein [Aeromicrobium sp.]MBC7632559.1 DUF58 domain-containing protein [Aeromicrobium sp.]